MRELSKMDKDMILQTYRDADNKKKAIDALAKVCDVDAETIKKVLRDKGALQTRQPKKMPDDWHEVKAPVIQEISGPEDGFEVMDLDNLPVCTIFADQAEDDTKLYETKHKKDPAKAAGPLPDYIQSVLFFKLLELEKEIDHMEDQLTLARQRHQQLREFLFN